MIRILQIFEPIQALSFFTVALIILSHGFALSDHSCKCFYYSVIFGSCGKSIPSKKKERLDEEPKHLKLGMQRNNRRDIYISLFVEIFVNLIVEYILKHCVFFFSLHKRHTNLRNHTSEKQIKRHLIDDASRQQNVIEDHPFPRLIDYWSNLMIDTNNRRNPNAIGTKNCSNRLLSPLWWELRLSNSYLSFIRIAGRWVVTVLG